MLPPRVQLPPRHRGAVPERKDESASPSLHPSHPLQGAFTQSALSPSLPLHPHLSFSGPPLGPLSAYLSPAITPGPLWGSGTPQPLPWQPSLKGCPPSVPTPLLRPHYSPQLLPSQQPYCSMALVGIVSGSLPPGLATPLCPVHLCHPRVWHRAQHIVGAAHGMREDGQSWLL